MTDAEQKARQMEGFFKGKPLERIVKSTELQDIQMVLKKEEVKINADLQKEMTELMKSQSQLNDTNQQLTEVKQKMESIKQQAMVRLSGVQEKQIKETTETVINDFLETTKTGENDKCVVDVHFLQANETVSSKLQIAMLGSGSRDAKFTVHMKSDVRSLLAQAAKYWGLDPAKVFFLDRDGRIVPEEMILKEIILPPAVPGSSPKGHEQSSSSKDVALAEHGHHQETYIVKGKPYCLNLVRAGTVLSSEDLSRPKGEKMDDFTFDAQQLNAELEETRKKYNQGDDGPNMGDLDNIPGLFGLIQHAQEARKKRWADTSFRAIEFLIFIASAVLFYSLSSPSDNAKLSMQLMKESVSLELNNFTNAEAALNNVTSLSFLQVTSNRQYNLWLAGPLTRAMVGSTLQTRNLAVMQVRGLVYGQQTPNVTYCASSTTTTTPTTVRRVLAAAFTSTTPTFRRLGLFGSSNSTTLPPGQATAKSADACVPPGMEWCPNQRVISLLVEGQNEGDLVPTCYGSWAQNSALTAFLESLKPTNAFTYLEGQVSSYASPTLVLDLTPTPSGGLSNFMTNVTKMMSSDAGTFQKGTMAQVIQLVVYAPSLQATLVISFLMENTLSGSIYTSIQSQVVEMMNISSSTHLVYVISVILAFVCFILELRRVFGWPKSCTYEDTPQRCRPSTVVHAILPLGIVATYGIAAANGSRHTADTIFMAPSLNSTANSTLTTNSTNSTAAVASPLENLYKAALLDNAVYVSYLLVLIIFNILYCKYLLTYFPQLVYVTIMIRKVAIPLITALVFVLLCFIVWGTWLMSLYSGDSFNFSSLGKAAIHSLRFVQGQIDDWQELYQTATTSYMIGIGFAFVIISMMVNLLPAAIMVSHLKEQEVASTKI